jgi:uncharacterized membrane protein
VGSGTVPVNVIVLMQRRREGEMMNEHESTETTPHRRRGLAEQSHLGERPNGGIDPPAYELDDRDGRDGLLLTTAPQEETHTRSLLKGFTWRIIATTTTTVIAWLVMGNLEAAFKIGFFEFFAKLLIYYVHERIWTRIRL